MRHYTSQIDITTSDDIVAQTVQAAMRQVRNEQVELYPRRKSTLALQEWKEYFRDKNPCELMVAYYFKGKPQLYTIAIHDCIPIKRTNHFAAIGVGGPLGNCLLHEHTSPDMEPELASLIAIKVVESAIKYVEACGAPTQVALIWKPPEIRPDIFMATLPGLSKPIPVGGFEDVILLSASEVAARAAIVAKVEAATKDNRNKRFQQCLRQHLTKEMRAFFRVGQQKKRKRRKLI